MKLSEKFKGYKSRVLNFQNDLNDMTEEATKNALVMPFFSMMGYDVFDPNEFIPEFVCDVGTKKGEKIDYAIIKDNEPIMIIEVKRSGMKLQKQQHSQLFRYFSVNRSRVAVLTNGVQYNFYSDINAPNIMDDEPFFSFNIIEDDESLYIQSLEQFTKKNFDTKEILSKALYLKYAKVMEKRLLKDFENPSDELIKYFLTQPEIKPKGRITSQIIEKYREITAVTLRKLMGISINNTINTISAPKNNQMEIKSQETTQTVTNTTAIQQPTLTPVEQLKNILNDYEIKEEDTPTFLRLHIYNSAGQKLAIVKISKPDMTNMQFKQPGNPTMYDLPSADDIKNYL